METKPTSSQYKTARKYLAEFIYGATDGTITTFAIIAGSMGALLSAKVILILGFSNLLADGFSMAASNYLSTKSQRDLDRNDKNNHNKKPIRTATATFFSFVVVGFIPLSSFVIAPFHPVIDEYKFIISIILTSLAFLIIGAIKGVITEKKRIVSAIEIFLVGSLAALIAFVAGYFLKDLA